MIGERFIGSRTIVWAAGVQASPAAEWLGVAADRAGRVVVEKDLSAPGLPNVFVVGDTASVIQEDGKPVPGIAPAAKQQGAYVAKVIKGGWRRSQRCHLSATAIRAVLRPSAGARRSSISAGSS
jgi:NADH dehydrogenase